MHILVVVRPANPRNHFADKCSRLHQFLGKHAVHVLSHRSIHIICDFGHSAHYGQVTLKRNLPNDSCAPYIAGSLLQSPFVRTLYPRFSWLLRSHLFCAQGLRPPLRYSSIRLFLSVTLLGSEHAHTVLTSTYSLFRLQLSLTTITHPGSPIRSFSSFSRARRPASLSSGSPPRIALGLHSPTRLQQWLATLVCLRTLMMQRSTCVPFGHSPPWLSPMRDYYSHRHPRGWRRSAALTRSGRSDTTQPFKRAAPVIQCPLTFSLSLVRSLRSRPFQSCTAARSRQSFTMFDLIQAAPAVHTGSHLSRFKLRKPMCIAS